MFIKSDNQNNIVIDKFCSCESYSPASGQFTYFSGNINSTIQQGSICNGGHSSIYYAMIYQYEGNSSLSYTNFTNCESSSTTAFNIESCEPFYNVSFCCFEKLDSPYTVSNFRFVHGRAERCNYINNLQANIFAGVLTFVQCGYEVLDSIFRLNRAQYIFYGQADIKRCYLDQNSGKATHDKNINEYKLTSSFENDIKFIGIYPCEGAIKIFHDNKIKCHITRHISYFSVIKVFMPFRLLK